jgi:mannose-6-phosphate isomerase-like protein (cupin superfamily)
MEGKIWGITEEIFGDDIYSVHHLSIIKSGFCSEHKHSSKYNYFFVLEGELEVTVWNADGFQDVTVLTVGQRLTVAPGVFHKFRALKATRALEIYYVKLSENDIERRTHGGLDD